MLRWMLPLGMGLMVLWALPAQAEDEEATPAKLRERIQTLEAQNATLVKLLDLSQRQVKQVDEARQLTQELLEATNETVNAFRERVDLLNEVSARQAERIRQDGVRIQQRDVQLTRARDAIAGKERELLDYYGSLIAQFGEPAAKVVAERLASDPAQHASRLMPLLAALGKDAQGALPALERIAADEKQAEHTRKLARDTTIVIRKAVKGG